MSVKLLNLDDLDIVTRVVAIRGTEYPVASQTVGQMLARIVMAKDSEVGDKDPEAILTNLKRVAQEILPTAPDSVISAMKVEQIVKLIEFVNASDSEVVGQATSEQKPEEIDEKK